MLLPIVFCSKKFGGLMFKGKGYHGTIKKRADNILAHGFRLSNKNTEWLGTGVYFFEDFKWAKSWAFQETERAGKPKEEAAVLSAVIRCSDELFFDLDKPENMLKIKNELQNLANIKNSLGYSNTKREETRCLICNFWKKKYNTQVMAYTFPRQQHNEMGFPFIVSQKQYCVTNKESIRNIKLEDIEGGTDYAI